MGIVRTNASGTRDPGVVQNGILRGERSWHRVVGLLYRWDRRECNGTECSDADVGLYEIA